VSPLRRKTQRTAKKTRSADKSRASKHIQSGKVRELYDQIIFWDWCKACGICSAFCPKKVIGRDSTGGPVIKRPDDCIGCRFCEFHCPDFAITIQKRNDREAKKQA
jgi:2-oxoglutarate ferredoxin oxidoreductase subunit delta